MLAIADKLEVYVEVPLIDFLRCIHLHTCRFIFCRPQTVPILLQLWLVHLSMEPVLLFWEVSHLRLMV